MTLNPQFKRGALELCVLSLLATKDMYGYELAEKISSQIDIAEGTLYPLLRRLQKEDYFETYLKESSEGPPRKYYRLTEKGHLEQQTMKRQWRQFVLGVEELIGE